MSRKGHALRVLAGIKLEDMELIAGRSCEVLSTVGELDIGAVFEGVDVFEVGEGFTVFL